VTTDAQVIHCQSNNNNECERRSLGCWWYYTPVDTRTHLGVPQILLRVLIYAAAATNTTTTTAAVARRHGTEAAVAAVSKVPRWWIP
jgi:hypothetical protein